VRARRRRRLANPATIISAEAAVAVDSLNAAR
jgi:hypothetical protein